MNPLYTVVSLMNQQHTFTGKGLSVYYASRRSRTRDTVKLTVCVCVPAVTL